MLLGFTDVDKVYDSVLDKMKKAGIDKVITEYKTQLDAYIASQK